MLKRTVRATERADIRRRENLMSGLMAGLRANDATCYGGIWYGNG